MLTEDQELLAGVLGVQVRLAADESLDFKRGLAASIFTVCARIQSTEGVGGTRDWDRLMNISQYRALRDQIDREEVH